MTVKRSATRFILGTLLVSTHGYSAPTKPKPVTESVQPARSERSIAAPERKKAGAAVPRPSVQGPKMSDALKQKLQQRLDARVDRDLKEIRDLRAEAVGLLETFVREAPKDSREMPDALLRLGELRWETEREGFIARFAAWEKLPVDQRGASPEPNYGPARELFGRVLSDYPGYAQLDLALYVDGFMAAEQGKVDESVTRFTRILSEFPRSRFAADAHMARAEAFFSAKSDFTSALTEYDEVLLFKDSDLVGLALFKSAWCLWKLGRSEEATVRFVRVFEETDKRGKTASNVQRKQLDELQGEALKYLVEVFSEDEKNTAGDMHRFLVKIGGDRFAGRIVKALAQTFYDQAHYERGIEAYELLLKLDPASRDAGGWVLEIASGYDSLEAYDKLRATFDRAAAQYTLGGTWAKTQSDPAVVKVNSVAIEKQLRQSALSIHAKAQRDKTSRAEFEAAAGLYEVYLTHFRAEPSAYELSFNLGEIEFHRIGKEGAAASHYLNAAREMPSTIAASEAGKSLQHDALYNALAALERVRQAEFEARKKQSTFTESETDKKFAEALDLYAQLFPQDAELPRLFFKQGKFYYDNAVFDPAVRIFGSLLERFPRSSEALPAGQLILESFGRSKNYENVEAWARRLRGAPAFQSAESQQKLEALILVSVFKQGESKSEAGDHAGAAAAYLRAAREFPKDSRAAQACVNAELAAQKAGDLRTLKEAALLVTGKDYRDRPESPQGAWIAASTLQSLGLFGEAAEIDEAMLQAADKDHPHYLKYEHTKDAAYNSVLLRTTIGEHDKAIANGNRFLTLYPGTPEADEVSFHMARAHMSAGRVKEAIETYRKFLGRTRSHDKKVQAFVELALALKKQGDVRGSDEMLRAAALAGKRGNDLGVEGKYAAAHARYLEGERILARFDEIEIQGDVKQLSQRLKQKADLLKQAANIFLDTVQMSVAEWSTAALFQIGRAYESFAKALRDAPPPANLSEADKAAYQEQIDGFVVPIEERALDAYENGWKRAVELGIFNQWTAKMRESLGRLNGELYPPLKEVGFEVRTQAMHALPPLLEAPKRGAKPPAKAGAR